MTANNQTLTLLDASRLRAWNHNMTLLIGRTEQDGQDAIVTQLQILKLSLNRLYHLLTK